jgi:ribonucleotide monophosphatase NagD (HAD superfamily)
LEASKKYNLDIKKTAFIGDVGSTDMLAVDLVGAKKILVLTGWEKSSYDQYRHILANVEPDYVAENLLDAVKWVIDNDVQ